MGAHKWPEPSPGAAGVLEDAVVLDLPIEDGELVAEAAGLAPVLPPSQATRARRVVCRSK
jgi:hypothetical protein